MLVVPSPSCRRQAQASAAQDNSFRRTQSYTIHTDLIPGTDGTILIGCPLSPSWCFVVFVCTRGRHARELCCFSQEALRVSSAVQHEDIQD